MCTEHAQEGITAQCVLFCSLPTIATNIMKKLTPDVEIHKIPV